MTYLFDIRDGNDGKIKASGFGYRTERAAKDACVAALIRFLWSDAAKQGNRFVSARVRASDGKRAWEVKQATGEWGDVATDGIGCFRFEL